MEKIKVTYDRPTTNLLVIRCKRNLLIVSGGANYSNAPGGAGGNDTYDDGESF